MSKKARFFIAEKLIHNRNNIKKNKADKFITGQSRYCQNCGQESRELFEVTQNVQKIHQLQYCDKCRENYKAKAKVAYNNKAVSA